MRSSPLSGMSRCSKIQSRYLFCVVPLMMLVTGPGCSSSIEQQDVYIFAAASLSEALPAALQMDSEAPGTTLRPIFNFAGSSSVARQILAGSPASIFVSAHPAWVDEIVAAGLASRENVVDLLHTRLAVIVPREQLFAPAALQDLRDEKYRHLALGDPTHVPAGLYASAALQRSGLWDALSPRVVSGQNVRVALAFVETGEAEAGIVYETDARLSEKVRIAMLLDADSHPPIRYQLVLLKGASEPSRQIFRRLQSESAQKSFAAFGFRTPERAVQPVK